jgi:hypothetical protein
MMDLILVGLHVIDQLAHEVEIVLATLVEIVELIRQHVEEPLQVLVVSV